MDRCIRKFQLFGLVRYANLEKEILQSNNLFYFSIIELRSIYYISINDRGGVKIHGRSDATLNPGGVRIGTSEIYKIVEKFSSIQDSVAVGVNIDGDEKILLFIKAEKKLDDNFSKDIKNKLKIHCSPRHVPYKIFQVKDIPYTLNGKKVEIAVKNIINNEEVLNISALINPESLKYFENLSI